MARLKRIRRGDTKNLTVEVSIPLQAGDELWFQARFKKSDPTPFISKSTTASPGGITMVDLGTEDGKANAVIKLDPADTNALTKDTIYLWEVELRTATGEKYTIDDGGLLVEQDVVR